MVMAVVDALAPCKYLGDLSAVAWHAVLSLIGWWLIRAVMSWGLIPAGLTMVRDRAPHYAFVTSNPWGISSLSATYMIEGIIKKVTYTL